MNERDVKRAVEQIRLSEEKKEELIFGIQRRMENKGSGKRDWRKLAAAATALVLMLGVVSIPVQAVVKNIVTQRMEEMSEEEVQEAAGLTNSQRGLEADVFSRGYTAKERARKGELKKAYENGTFPEGELVQVEHEEDVKEGTLCYVRDTGCFYLPKRALTDEELLEIIDFDYKSDYALSQTPDAGQARKEHKKEQARLEEQVLSSGGISREEAAGIARERMKARLGVSAEMEDADVLIVDGSLTDSGKAEVYYVVMLGNSDEGMVFTCEIDALDGSVLKEEP